MEQEQKRIAETHLSNLLWMTNISNLEILFHKDNLRAEDSTVQNDMILNMK